MDNNIMRLPDAYYKTIGGNLRNLLQIAFETSSIATEDFNNINDSRDIHEATGKTLDYYGSMVGESRNGATDEQYLTKILNKIGVNTTGSDINSVIKAIAQMMNAQPTDISLLEGNSSVTVIGLTIDMIESSGYSGAEINSMIKNLLPIGVSLGRIIYGGTLLISGTSPTAILEEYPVLFPAWYLSQREYVLREKDVGLSGEGTVPNAFLEVGAGREPTDDVPWYNNIGTDGMTASGTYTGGTLGTLY